MSGGHFEYKQYTLGAIAEDIDRLINKALNYLDNPPKEDDYERCYQYRQETIDKFTQTRDALIEAAKMVQRVDWLVSGDDSEDSFHKRWQEEIKEL